jgi:plasmid stabilization system protein ParE
MTEIDKLIKPEVGEEKYKLSKESAQNELKKMLDYYEIDIEAIEDENLKRAIGQGYDRLVKAVRLGRLKIKLEKGIEIIQILRSNGNEISYREIDGVSKMEMAGKKQDDYYGKSYALMGSLCGMGESAIKQLKGVDLSLCEVLGLIFLSV